LPGSKRPRCSPGYASGRFAPAAWPAKLSLGLATNRVSKGRNRPPAGSPPAPQDPWASRRVLDGQERASAAFWPDTVVPKPPASRSGNPTGVPRRARPVTPVSRQALRREHRLVGSNLVPPVCGGGESGRRRSRACVRVLPHASLYVQPGTASLPAPPGCRKRLIHAPRVPSVLAISRDSLSGSR
jgi:hypothetical protein